MEQTAFAKGMHTVLLGWLSQSVIGCQSGDFIMADTSLVEPAIFGMRKT